MLDELTIKNVAVIDKLSVTFDNGLLVLTGETGAGKSIIIDSINMILGARATKDLVRRGADYAQVEAVFTVRDEVRKVLEQNDIECEDDQIIITRKITADGKSYARINGCTVTLNTMRDIADLLINIHGQHDNQALLTPSKHLSFLDGYANTNDELNSYQSLFYKRRDIKKSLFELQNNESQRMQRLDLLQYQVNEIEKADISPEEEDELIARRDILARAEEINSATQNAYEILYGGENAAYDIISRAVSELEGIFDVNPDMESAYEAISSAMYSIEDSARSIRDFGESVEFDQEVSDEVEERIDLINRLKRKYGGTTEAVIEYGKNAKSELKELQTSDERVQLLQTELSKIDKEIESAAAALTKKRADAAEKLANAIENSLHELNMEKARFSVNISEKPYSSDGADAVEFLIETNVGEGLKPLVKIASGGELSRVMLAIKSILADKDSAETMIFDEIDTGVSGSAAQRIAEKLKAIAKTSQVICITHLPQLASVADTHYLIRKDIEDDRAKTTLTKLDYDGRVNELSRIVGGGAAGIEYAKKILNADS